MTTNNLETLHAALSALETLDPREIVADFLRHEHSCKADTYCAAVLDPETGEIAHNNTASRSCSADEYFGESGLLSRTTLLSSTRSHWSPSPDDGFEWIDGDDFVHPEGNFSGWITRDKYETLDAERKQEFTEWFSVGDEPITGWLDNADHQISLVEQQITSLMQSIREKIGELENEEAAVV